MSLRYPQTRRDDTFVDDLHGDQVADPYRWLEDTNSAETSEWVKLQNELTESFFAGLPARAEIRQRLSEVWDYPRVGAPTEHGGRWFQLRNTGLQPQSVLYVMSDADDTGAVLLDPNTLSDDGTVALMAWAVSPDGALLAYGTSASGSDWITWRFRDIAAGTDLPDILEWSKFGGAAFSPDVTDVFYTAYDAPTPGREYLQEARIPRLTRHRLGTPQSDDTVVFTAPDQPEWGVHADTTDDGSWLIVHVSRGTFPENQLHVLDLARPEATLQPVSGDFACEVSVVGNVRSTFYLSTDDGAERRRIVTVDVDVDAAVGRDSWREVVPESDDTLVEAHVFGGRIVAHYLHDAHSLVRVFGLDGTPLHEMTIPANSTVSELSGRFDRDTVHLAVTSFTDSGSLWVHDLNTGRTERRVAPSSAVDADAMVTEQAFVSSDDGTRVPVFLVRRRDVQPTGDVPVLLYGYGGFRVPITPEFSALRAVWVERGGLLAVANLRGGGEYGRGWYDAGRLANKQNVFDDFCAVARWLGGESGWSRASRIAIHGRSNGGLLVGASMTQQPELFGAAVPGVGVLDMLRYHRFTIGWAWTSDYGDPDDPEQYPWVRAYSPLHNVRPGTRYPATLVLTGDHDDRVAPGHSFKFAAALQAAQAATADEAPVLIRVDTSAGHGAGKPTQKLLDETADLLTFVEHALAV